MIPSILLASGCFLTLIGKNSPSYSAYATVSSISNILLIAMSFIGTSVAGAIIFER
jgi:hypothetical protein